MTSPAVTPPAPEVRAARPEEAEATLQTLCAAFGLDTDAARPIFYGDPFYDISHKRILTLPGQGVVSCLTLVPALLRVGGVPVAAAGIAGVATRPHLQRRGHAQALIGATVPALWDELGCPLSLLHALSASFYRRSGWEHATRAARWAAVPAALPHHPEAARVRPARDGDWGAIRRVHAQESQAGTATCVRDDRRWALIRLPVPGREAWVYEDGPAGDAGDGVTGYLLWERRETLELLEMHGHTERACRGLAGHLAAQPDALVEWHTSPALLARLGLPPSQAPPEPDTMLRIVDLGGALAAVHAAHYAPVLAEDGATLTVFAADALRPENARPLRLTPQGVVAGASDGSPWLRAGIGTLAQLYLGYHTPSEACAVGLLSSDSPDTLALADRLFPARQPYLAPLDQV